MKKNGSRFIYKSCIPWYMETDAFGMGKHKTMHLKWGDRIG